MSPRSSTALSLVSISVILVLSACQVPSNEQPATQPTGIAKTVDDLAVTMHLKDAPRKLDLGPELAQTLKDAKLDSSISPRQFPDEILNRRYGGVVSLLHPDKQPDTTQTTSPDSSQSSNPDTTPPITLDKTYNPKGDPDRWLDLIKKAETLIDNGKYREAEDVLSDAMQVCPNDEANVVTGRHYIQAYFADHDYATADAYAVDFMKGEEKLGHTESAKMFEHAHEKLQTAMHKN